MFKTIVCFVTSMLCYFQSGAQSGVVDSLRSLIEKINNIPADNSCKKINEYKAAISKIDPGTFNDALAQFISADGDFITANKKSCPIRKVISDLDSLLKDLKVSGSSDSSQILRAILYVKYKDLGFASLTLMVLNDKQLKIGNPGITLNSFEPYVIPPGNQSDSAAREIYIRPGKEYFLTVTDSGYSPYSEPLIAKNDTVLSIALTGLTGGTGVIIKPPQPLPDTTTTTTAAKSYWWIPAVLLVLVLLALVWKIISGKKKNAFNDEALQRLTLNNPDIDGRAGKLKESISQLNERIKEKDTIIDKDAAVIENLKLKVESMSKVNISDGNANTKMPTKYFLSEIMMTAGPRKPTNDLNSDGDLGEDVCGFMMAGDEVLVWLLDGASDKMSLRNPDTQREYFSSRLLAQSIARKLKSHFADRKTEPFNETMATITDDVKSDWLEAMRSLPESEKNVLIKNLKDGVRPECATTVLIGRLSLGGELMVYRSGDSKMLVYSASGDQKVYLDTTLSTKNNKINPVSFVIGLTEKDELDINHNQRLLKFEIVRQENIQTIIGFSDGVGSETQQELKKEYPINSDAMRKEIIYQVQGTKDDKSLYIIEIKE